MLAMTVGRRQTFSAQLEPGLESEAHAKQREALRIRPQQRLVTRSLKGMGAPHVSARLTKATWLACVVLDFSTRGRVTSITIRSDWRGRVPAKVKYRCGSRVKTD
jgi:hypothetical protein